MSIIGAIRDYLVGYSGLEEGAPVWVDYLGQNPTEYTVVPIPGNRIIETYLDGSSLREYAFAFRSMESTADDLARIESSSFYESFADWLETQTEAGSLPEMDSGQIAERIEALGWGYLFEQGVSATGIYQVQCRLVYKQQQEE